MLQGILQVRDLQENMLVWYCHRDQILAPGLNLYIIDMPEGAYMHPRFTIVNMYKRKCERDGAKFGMNKTVDSIGAALERPYEHARAK